MAVDGGGLFQLYTAQYSVNLELLLQQMGSLLRGTTREGFHVGKMASPINQVGAAKLQKPAGRFAPKNRTDVDLVRRWLMPQDGELDQLIDSFDELKTIVDPKSTFTQTAGMAVGRAWDDSILAATTATAFTGVDAGSLTTETFDTSTFRIASTFGSSAASGLTVSKLIELKRIFRHFHNALESDQITVAMGSQQESDLLNQVQVVSSDFNDRPVLVEGKVTRFLGMDFKVLERVPEVTAGSVRGVVAWVKSGMHLGMWKDMSNRVSIRNDLSGEPYDLWTSSSFGATRLQAGKVVQILCADTTGVDITP